MARKFEESLPHFVFELHDTFNAKSNVFVLPIIGSSHYSLQVSRVPHKVIIRGSPMSTITLIHAPSSRAFGIISTENGLNCAMQLSYNGLEDDHRKPLTNLFGQAVAQLFLFSSPEMYASSNASESSEYRVGFLFLKERETATVSRWDFWK